MSTNIIPPRGIVVSIWGKAYIKGADGQWRPLKLGEMVRPGDALLTEQDSIVLMTDGAGQVGRARLEPGAGGVDRAIAALESGERDAAPAAGLAGGDGGDLQPGLRVMRVAEIVDSVDAVSIAPTAAATQVPTTLSDPDPQASSTAVSAPSSSIAALEGGAAVALGLTSPSGSGPIVVTVTQVPVAGQIVTASGTVVSAGAQLSAQDLAGLQYLPPADYVAGSPVGSFAYTASNGQSSSTGNVLVSLGAVNDAPAVAPDAASTVGTLPVTVNVLANDSDVDGNTLSVSGATVPAAQGSVTVNPDGSLTFVPAAGVSGPVTIQYTVSDGNGGSTTSALVVTVSAAPTLTLDAPALTNDTTPLITGTTNLPPGTVVTLTVTDANGNTQTVAAVVLADGSFAASVPNALPEGPYSVTATAGSGSSTTGATDGGSVDAAAPTITVAAPALGNDATPLISGSADVPAGSAVTLTVTGSNGAVQAFTATVQADGSYAAAVPGALSDGPFSVTAVVAGANGAPATASTSGVLDTTPPQLTLVLDSVTADNAVSAGEAAGIVIVTGRAGGDVTAGDIVTLAINGKVYSGAIQADGRFSIAVPGSDLAVDADRRIDASITSTDAAGNAGTQTAVQPYTVDLSGPPNTPPLANADSLAATEDTAVTYAAAQLTGNDTDAEGNPLVIASVTSGSGGTAVLNPDGTVTFTPNAHFNGSADFTYTVTDGALTSNTATVSVNVAAVNDAPTLTVTASYDFTEDSGTAVGAIVASYSTFDEEGSPVTVTLSDTTHYALDGAGNVTLTAAGLALVNSGADLPAFTLTPSDGSTSGSAVAVDPAVAAVNDAPVANPDSLATSEDSSLTIAAGTLLVNDTDADGNPLSIVGVQAAVNGTVALVNGDVVFTPAANYSGPASFTYTISDGQGGFSTATVNLTVLAVNDAPVASGSALTTAEDTPLTVSLIGSDIDGTIASVALTTLPVSGTLYLADGVTPVLAGTALTPAQAATLLYVPAPNASGSFSLRFTVTDDGGLVSPAATTTITVTPVNDAPIAVADSRTVAEGSTSSLVSVLANDSDVEGLPLSVTAFAASAVGTAVVANGSNSITTALGGTVTMNADGSFTYTAPVVTHDTANTPVIDSFVYRASDGTDASAWTTVTLNLNDTTPIATSENGTVAWNTTLTGNILTNDSAIDQPKALLSVAGTPIAATGSTSITTANGVLSIAADGSFIYTSTLAATATASGGDEATFRSTLGGLWGFDNANWSTGSNLNLGALAVQPDLVNYQGGAKPGLTVGSGGIESGESLILRLPESTTSATLALNQLNASQPTAAWSAYDAGGVLVASGTFGPGPANGSTSLQTILTATPFTYLRLSNAGSSGQGFRVAAVEYGLLPANHVDAFSYTMRDADGDTSTATFTVQPGTTSIFNFPLASGGAPVAVGESINMSEDTVFVGSVAGNDVPSTDGGNLWTVTGAPANGSLSFNVDGSFSYVPAADFVGSDSFSYRIKDADGSVSTATVSITVAAVNDVPVVLADSATATEDTPLTISPAALLGNDSDADADTLTIVSVQNAVNGTVALVAGNIVFTPAADYNGPASFTYTVSDGHGGTATATVDVTVSAVNDAPVARDDALATSEDSALVISASTLLGNDSDVEGNTLTIASVTSGSGGTAVLNADGTVTFTPNANFNGTA
ncbi:MAG TPA: tandem-95 repeat protein, partial [Burkholderiaceae bacterium]|nr:tandem-95 repeat protein [Burkholderiaceae bacterium]